MGKQLNAESGDGTWAVLVQPLELICGGAEWGKVYRESAELEDGGRLKRIRGSHWKGVFSKIQLIIQSLNQCSGV